jgi:hypothetical protein
MKHQVKVSHGCCAHSSGRGSSKSPRALVPSAPVDQHWSFPSANKSQRCAAHASRRRGVGSVRRIGGYCDSGLFPVPLVEV